jgi:hypothetical protein
MLLGPQRSKQNVDVPLGLSRKQPPWKQADPVAQWSSVVQTQPMSASHWPLGQTIGVKTHPVAGSHALVVQRPVPSSQTVLVPAQAPATHA